MRASVNELLAMTLDVYEPECRYLISVNISSDGTLGEFSVPETVYAVKGRKYHLNAAEVIIAYEQIMYVRMAHLFINGFDKCDPIPINAFFPKIVDEKVLIAQFDTRLVKQVDHMKFTGIFSVKKVIRKKSGNYWFDTVLDINSGAQVANVKIHVDLQDLLS